MLSVNPEGTVSGGADSHGHVHDHGHAGGGGGTADLSAEGKQKYGESFMKDLPGPITAAPPKGYGSDALTDPARTKEANKQLDSDLATAFPNGVEFNPAIKPADGPEAAKAKWGLLNAAPAAGGAKSAEGDHVVRFGDTTRMMTTRTDAAGKTTATLHAQAAPEIPAGSKFSGANEAERVKAAKQAFKDDFGITVKPGVDGNGNAKNFTADELEKVHSGLARLSPEERKALNGTELVRNQYVRQKNGNTVVNDKTHSAFYGSSVEKSGGTWVNKKTMQIADSAFNQDKTAFVGDGTKDGSSFPSARTAAHEAGHGIEFNRRNDAWAARNNALGGFNSASKTLDKGPQAAWDKTNKGLSPADKGTAKAFDTASKAVDAAALEMAQAKAPELAAKTEAYEKSVKTRDAALKALPPTHPAHTQATALAKGQDTAFKDVASTSAAQVKASSSDGTESRQLEKFEEFIKDNNVKPTTDYGAGSNAEFYAESLSLYKTDPQYLKANSPKLYDYFKNNEHLSDASDATAGKALDGLAGASRPIAGNVMGKALLDATGDTDNHAASTEYKELKKFATDNWSDMSPQAKKQFEIYEKYAKAAQAKGSPGILLSEWNKMKTEIEAVK